MLLEEAEELLREAGFPDLGFERGVEGPRDRVPHGLVVTLDFGLYGLVGQLVGFGLAEAEEVTGVAAARDPSQIDRDEVFWLLDDHACFGLGASFACPFAQHDDEVVGDGGLSLRAALADLVARRLPGVVAVEEDGAGGLVLIAAAGEVQHVGHVGPAGDERYLVEVETLAGWCAGAAQAGIHAGDEDLVGHSFDEPVVAADERGLGDERAEGGAQWFVVVLGDVLDEAGALVAGALVDNAAAVASVAVDEERRVGDVDDLIGPVGVFGMGVVVEDAE